MTTLTWPRLGGVLFLAGMFHDPGHMFHSTRIWFFYQTLTGVFLFGFRFVVRLRRRLEHPPQYVVPLLFVVVFVRFGHVRP